MILNKKVNKAILPVCFILSCFITVAQQRYSEKPSGGIIVSGKTGISYLVSEVYRDFTGTASEFNSLPGGYTGMEVSRFFTSALEAGGGISYSALNGHTDNPAFSGIGYDHFLSVQPINGPVQFINRLYGPEVFARYHFDLNPANPQSLTLFLKAGAGVLFNESELFFKERQGDDIIFGKGFGKYKTTQVSNGNFILGSGLSYALDERINLKLAANFNLVGYDLLDVVHNYDAEGNRREVMGLFTDLTVGIAVNLGGKENQTTASSKSSKGKYLARSHLPFSPSQ